eukprot:454088-Amorphochlora_amoeboformis.AAC.1
MAHDPNRPYHPPWGHELLMGSRMCRYQKDSTHDMEIKACSKRGHMYFPADACTYESLAKADERF